MVSAMGMKEANLAIPYGKGRMRFSLPRHRLLGTLVGRRSGARRDLKAMLGASLAAGPNAKRLHRIAADSRRVLIVVPDATRSSHLKVIIPELIRRISKRPAAAIDIIVATGLHKRHTCVQLEDLLGGAAVRRCRVLCHQQEKAELTKAGSTRKGTPIVLNRRLKDYDRLITIGVIEPHLYAGYSGGIKTIAIGLAGEETINVTHGIRFLGDPGTRIGSVRGNPFQDELWEIAKGVKVDFAINAVNDADGRALAVFSGDIRDVFRDGVGFCGGLFEVTAESAADIVICGIGHPKDVNLYQASRAVNYVLNVDRPVLRKGGVLIVAAGLRDGIGEGLSERRFYGQMRKMGSPADFLKTVARKGFLAGVHRAFMLAGPMSEYRIVFVVKGGARIMRGLPFPYFETIADALRYADSITGADSKIYVIPRALATIAKRK